MWQQTDRNSTSHKDSKLATEWYPSRMTGFFKVTKLFLQNGRIKKSQLRFNRKIQNLISSTISPEPSCWVRRPMLKLQLSSRSWLSNRSRLTCSYKCSIGLTKTKKLKRKLCNGSTNSSLMTRWQHWYRPLKIQTPTLTSQACKPWSPLL